MFRLKAQCCEQIFRRFLRRASAKIYLAHRRIILKEITSSGLIVVSPLIFFFFFSSKPECHLHLQILTGALLNSNFLKPCVKF